MSLTIDSKYKHYFKQVTIDEPLETPSALLKWYSINLKGKPMDEQVVNLARAYVKFHALEISGLGFTILHKCGSDFYFLIVCTWQNSNELWESVFYKNGAEMQGFLPFNCETGHKPTLCVWELVPVWHEQKSWVSFLNSSRDEIAARAWLVDCFSGEA